MKFPIGQMSVGDILDRGLKLLLARLGTFYAITFIVLLPLLMVQLATPAIFSGAEGTSPASAATVGLLILVLSVILGQIDTGAILYVVSQEFVDRSVSVGDAITFALGKIVSLIGAAFLVGLVVGFGLILCLIPGFIFLTWYAFAAQVVVVEGKGAIDAMGRSKELSDGHRWRIFGVLILLGLISFGIGILAGILQVVLPYNEVVPTASGIPIQVFKSYPNYVINTVFTFLLQVVIGSYQAICVTLLYFDLRIRKEGFDLEMAAQQQMSVQ